MTDHTTQTPASTDDWWDRLYNRDGTEQPQAPTVGEGSRVRPVTGRSGRLPDWRRGPAPLPTLSPEEENTGTETGQRDTETARQDTGQDTDVPVVPRQSDGQDTETAPADSETGKEGNGQLAPLQRFQARLRKQDTEPAPQDTAGTDSSPGQDTPAPDTERPRQDTGTDTPPPAAKSRVRAATDDRTLRVIAFNATAASAGYATGLVSLLSSALPAAEQAATGVFASLLTAAGAITAWKLTGLEYVRVVLPQPLVSRIVLTTIAAEVARRMGPLPVVWLDQHGTAWGLGPGAISLLATTAGMCGGLWWLIDRRIRHWHWTARWLARTPLASALLATALYAPGPSL
ncbi:hypothetical protein [Streptomyces barkulensis]|uniref:hypothetical protein n=1 Tax=Streptomyces barkulensis TaxID=1257026 RepID=UPI000C6EAE81|nr:hypothetical protein [Streptomyces barkulensis]